MSLIGNTGRHRTRTRIGLAVALGAVGIAAAAVVFGGGSSEAAESCQGLDTALQNNLNFIAAQQANPDAQSEARIANRQAVVDQIQQRRQVAGCTGNVVAQPVTSSGSGESCQGLDTALQNNLNFIAAQRANPDAQSEGRIANRQAVVDLIQQRRQAAGCTASVQPTQPNQPEQPAGNPAVPPVEQPPAEQPPVEEPPAEQPPAEQPAGEVVCPGSTVTLFDEGGAPAASSNQFPAGTELRVTNLDNNKSTTVKVTSFSASCVLLNNAAFEQVREPGKFLIRRATIERVG